MINEALTGMVLVTISTIIGSVGALLFKFVSEHVTKNIFLILIRPSLYIAVILYGLSALVFVFALKFGDLSVLYPIAALSYIWVSLLSIIFLKEKMNLYKWSGLTSIILGIILIGISA